MAEKKKKEIKKETEKEAKDRIFDAAKSLFARKGYAAVSVREIAKKAKVNISMLNYYYGGKLGILREVLSRFYEKYFDAILNVDIEHLTKEELILEVIQNLIRFYRENTMLAVAAHNTFAVDMPEIADLEMKWVTCRRKQINEHFVKFGLDTNDCVTMTVMRGLIWTVISKHFQSKYAWEYTIKSSKLDPKKIKEFVEEETALELNDEFYKKYAEVLANFYLHGLDGITGKEGKKKGGK